MSAFLSRKLVYAIRIDALFFSSGRRSMEEFIAHQIELVETERKVDVEETVKLLSSYAPIQLQRRGIALVGLKVTGKKDYILGLHVDIFSKH